MPRFRRANLGRVRSDSPSDYTRLEYFSHSFTWWKVLLMVRKHGSWCSFNAPNTTAFQQIYFWLFRFDIIRNEQYVVHARQGLPQSYIRDQVWWQRSWANVLIFLRTPLKSINYGTCAVKERHEQIEGKLTRIPFQLCKIHLVFPLQTNKQTNKQTDSGSTEWQWLLCVSIIFHILETRHCYILFLINNQLRGYKKKSYTVSLNLNMTLINVSEDN